LIVQLPSPSDPAVDQLYLADVGFGGIFGVSGLVRPIPLINGATVAGSAAPECHRIIVAGHPSSAISLSDEVLPKDWMLQANRDPANEEWRTLFHFSLACELFELDVECQSFSVSNHNESPLVSRLFCIKVFEVEDDPETLGRISLIGDRLVRRIGMKSEEVCSFTTESERVAALKEHCGIYLEPEEVQCMRGRLPALPMG
jgi:arylamine N-acetyltransferase